MLTHHRVRSSQVVDDEWISFPGGELEGKRPKARCAACREKLEPRARPSALAAPLCFQCYRAELDRKRALEAAEPDDARWQWLLPFEPINRPRLEMLRAERGAARAALQRGAARYVDQRRRAQIAARHALQGIAAGLRARAVPKAEQNRVMAEAVHAAELQLPESWLAFVVSK